MECVTTEPGRQWVFLHRASLTFSVMCLPQLGAQYFPTYHLLSKDSGASGRTKLNRGFRKCLMHTRICTQVCKFLEMISKDEICCLLRPDLLLRWSGCSHLSLCCPSSPSAHLPPPALPLSIPLCAPLPHHPLLFSPALFALSFVLPSLCPVAFSLFREGVKKLFLFFFFFLKIQVEYIVGFLYYTVSNAATHLCCCSTKTGKENMSANGHGCVPVKLYRTRWWLFLTHRL